MTDVNASVWLTAVSGDVSVVRLPVTGPRTTSVPG